MSRRGSVYHEPRCLAPLVDKTELLQLTNSGRVIVPEKMPPILDEFGIPRRVDMVKTALATLAVEHTWTGEYDLHHMAYEGQTYRSIVGPDQSKIGSLYRGSGLLKVHLPRQLHEYMHAIYEIPPVPDIEVMCEFGRESEFLNNLFNTVRIDSYRTLPELDELPFEQQEKLRVESFKRKIDAAPVPEFGIIPDLNQLAELEIQEARRVLRAIARASGLDSVLNRQPQYFLAETR